MSKARDSFLIAIAAPTKGCFIGAGHCVVPRQFPLGTKPIYEDKLVQGIECTCKSKQLGQALKKCFNPNTLPRLQVFIVGCRLKGKNGTTRRKPSRQYLPCSSIRHFRPFKVIQDSRLGSLWGLKGSSKPGNFTCPSEKEFLVFYSPSKDLSDDISLTLK